MAKKKPTNGIAVAQCSLCDQVAVTIGEQRMGGIRYCKDCLTHTLAWVQMDDEQRAKAVALYDEAAAKPEVIALLAVAKKIPAKTLKDMSVGESRRRMLESMQRGEQ